MSLEQIKDQLKRKPRATKNEPVEIVTVIEIDNDDRDADEIIKKLKQKGIIKVVSKEEEIDFSREYMSVDPPVTRASKITSTPKSKVKKVSIQDISVLEGDDEERDITQTKERKTPKPVKGVSNIPVEEWVDVKNQSVIDRLPPAIPQPRLRVSGYYLNNRKKFVNFINSYFSQYRDEILNDELSISCDNIGKDDNPEFKLLIHQKIQRDYLNFIQSLQRSFTLSRFG